MPSAAYQATDGIDSTLIGGNAEARTRCLKPMVNSGSLDKYKHFDVTPVIGREYADLQVTELLKGDAQLIKDLAVTGMLIDMREKPIRCTYMSHSFRA